MSEFYIPNSQNDASSEVNNASDWFGDVVYQVYPRTFNDSNSDGIGDLVGVSEKIPYLKDLGIDAVWLSPFYPSGGIDGGYDISNYIDVDSDLGSLEDFDRLVRTAHENGMKVIVDLVPNHTSDQHEWFKESRASRDNPKSDWYIWHDGLELINEETGELEIKPPNNWSSVFSLPQYEKRANGEIDVPEGEYTPAISAWQWDETRQQFYLRDFAREQPNLNWLNPDVREAIKEVERFWIERGVDGFRVDVANHLAKDPAFRDEDPDPTYIEGVDNPHDQIKQERALNYEGEFEESGESTLKFYIKELISVNDEYPEKNIRFILEAWMPREKLNTIDMIRPVVASSFNFPLLRAPWNAEIFRATLDEYYSQFPSDGNPNVVLGNHDVDRVVTRYGVNPARALAAVLLTLRGSPYIYNGEEGGFSNTDIPTAKRKDSNLGLRDGGRSPMKWDATKNAGFSRAETEDLWLPVDEDYLLTNLESQKDDATSFLNLYRSLIALRQSNRFLLVNGSQHLLHTDNSTTGLLQARRNGRNQVLTMTNFSPEKRIMRPLKAEQAVGRIMISSLVVSERSSEIIDLDRGIELAPYESVVVFNP